MANCVRCDKPLTESTYSLSYRQSIVGKSSKTVSIAHGLCKPCMTRISSFIRLAPGRCRKCRNWAWVDETTPERKKCECEPV